MRSLILLLLASALLTCSADVEPEPSPSPEKDEPEPEPTDEHEPEPEHEHEPLPSEAECRECHEDVAAQWARSRHHLAFRNADFQRAFAREPRDFCRNCHAPALARSEQLGAAEAEALGVGCLDCHGGDDTLLAGPQADADAAPHPLSPTAEFTTQSCGRCHEFDFPPTSRRRPGTMMQLTMREHRASDFADRSCADCHLPAGDHSLDSSRDPEAIRRAVTITARREGDALLVELAPVGVGHAFPTGDLYRRVELHAERHVDGRVVATAKRYLDREFQPWRYRDARLNPHFHDPVVDDRLTGPTQIRLELAAVPEQSGGELIWWVDYERVDARDDLALEQSSIASEVRLAEGRL